MYNRNFKFFLHTITVGIVGWFLVGCDQNPLETLSPEPRTSPSQVASPGVSTAPNPPSTSPKPSSGSSGTVPATPSVDASLPPLSAEDQVKTQQMEKELKEKGGKLAVQPAGKTALDNILISQQTEKIVKGRFASDIKQLAADMPTQTEEYHLQVVQADAAKAIVTATAKTAGLPSYTGAVFAVEAKIPIAGICKTKIPSETPPSPPTLMGETVKCASDSVSAN